MKNLEFTDNEKLELIYDIFAGLMAIIATLIVLMQFSGKLNQSERSYLDIADKVVYVIFLFDAVIRFILSKNKQNYLKNNMFDAIAVIPFDFLTTSPLGGIFKLLKVIAYILRLIDNLRDILFTNGFIYSLGATLLVTILGAFGIYFFEKNTSQTIKSLGDAIWWSFVTVTTVGYGDISPTTTIGRVIACILMLTGIGFLGMLTSTISTYFINRRSSKEQKLVEESSIQNHIIDLAGYSDEQIKLISDYAIFIRDKYDK